MHNFAHHPNQLMPHLRRAEILLATIGLLVLVTQRSFATEPAAAIPAPNGLPWIQTFSNDFTSSSASQYLSNWTKQTGDGTAYGLPAGWGNGEAENYTSNSTNLNVTSAGLKIVAVVNGSNITSARITSQNYFSQTYGLFQFTASFPSGSGLWPALWMLPEPNSYGGWPTSGEVDVMESGVVGSTPDKQVQGSYHSGTAWYADDSQTATYSNASFDTRNVNTYDLLWLPASTQYPNGALKWYVNGFLYETQSGGWYNPGGGTNAAPFDKPFYLMMNLAVGGPSTGYTGGATPANGSYTMTISDVEAFSVPQVGDMNRNGHVDAGDVTAMINALTNESSFAAAHGVTTEQLGLIGDVNNDGKFNNADVQALLNFLKSGNGSTSSVPEPTTFYLLAFGGLLLWRQKSAWPREIPW